MVSETLRWGHFCLYNNGSEAYIILSESERTAQHVSFWFWLGVLLKKHTSGSKHTYFLHPAVKYVEI